MADLPCSEGRCMAGAQQEPQSQRSMATPVAWVVGAWVLDAGEGRGGLGGKGLSLPS